MLNYNITIILQSQEAWGKLFFSEKRLPEGKKALFSTHFSHSVYFLPFSGDCHEKAAFRLVFLRRFFVQPTDCIIFKNMRFFELFRHFFGIFKHILNFFKIFMQLKIAFLNKLFQFGFKKRSNFYVQFSQVRLTFFDTLSFFTKVFNQFTFCFKNVKKQSKMPIFALF